MIMCWNDELSLMMSWVGCLLKDTERFILFAENSQIPLKISVVPILITFMHLEPLNLLTNNKLNSSYGHIIVTLNPKRLGGPYLLRCHIWWNTNTTIEIFIPIAITLNKCGNWTRIFQNLDRVLKMESQLKSYLERQYTFFPIMISLHSFDKLAAIYTFIHFILHLLT